MDLSIVIVSYNTREMLRTCLDSIRESAPTVACEVVVVDNGSKDGSPELVEADYRDVTLIRNDSNRGFSAACNCGVAVATGRYVLLLNSDTIVLPGSLDSLVQFADEHPDAGVVGCRLLDGDRQLTHSLAFGFLFRTPARCTKTRNLRNGWVSGACMLLRRSACEKVGWLDEDFFFGVEDVELCWRMLRRGWRVYSTAAAEVVHYGSGSSGKKYNPGLHFEVKRGGWLLMKKHGTPVHRLVWVLLMLLELLDHICHQRRDRVPVYLRALRLPFAGARS